MDNWHLLDSVAQQEQIAKLSLVEKAEKNCLPEYLSIKEISELAFPLTSPFVPKDPDKRSNWYRENRPIKKSRLSYQNQLILACESRLLDFEGEIKGWDYFGENDYPLAKDAPGQIFIPDPSRSFYYDSRDIPGLSKPIVHKCKPNHCTIHKHEFKCYLKKYGQWPVKGLLAYWMVDNVKQANESIHESENKEIKNNDVEYSGLLNVPKKIDGWFEVIDDMARAFFKKNNHIPNNQAMAWGQLWTNPPEGYEIKTIKDKDKSKGNDSLQMPGIKPLSLSGFKKRWKGYTR